MSLGTILLIVLILMLIGSIPAWSHSKQWGYGPSGGLGLIVIILIVLLVLLARILIDDAADPRSGDLMSRHGFRPLCRRRWHGICTRSSIEAMQQNHR